ncbi:MAG: acetyl-CoA carboxylase carboxyl transferase subunit alpha [Candidatus Coatesbacteria bacterium]|nr:MAG: acetyl-CoA carboxylase carboxyl transferase subunit alpha [Candidatus Coatesbacteria bacterium]
MADYGFGVLDFEKPIYDMETKIKELERLQGEEGLDLKDEIKALRAKANKLREEIFANLDSWQRIQLARHPKRPYTTDYVENMLDDFIEIHGDRLFRDDKAILAGFGVLDGQTVCIVGHNKGHTTKENLERNFGSPHPEGYRKGLRVMRLADKFGVPIITFLDSAGAYPGIGAEERGQAEAIAKNILEMFKLGVPIIVCVTGEGGSGGALGIGVGDVVLMQEYTYYSVISPEGCAAILWRDRAEAPTSAKILRITAPDLMKLGVIDEIVSEPIGGAHNDYKLAAENLKKAIVRHLKPLLKMGRDELIRKRREKFRKMGYYAESIEESKRLLKEGMGIFKS